MLNPFPRGVTHGFQAVGFSGSLLFRVQDQRPFLVPFERDNFSSAKFVELEGLVRQRFFCWSYPVHMPILSIVLPRPPKKNVRFVMHSSSRRGVNRWRQSCPDLAPSDFSPSWAGLSLDKPRWWVSLPICAYLVHRYFPHRLFLRCVFSLFFPFHFSVPNPSSCGSDL